MKLGTQQISGWGGYPVQDALVLCPNTSTEFKSALKTLSPCIARGMGRSYGDSAMAELVLQTHQMDHFKGFDPSTGLLSVQAGVTLREILKLVVPRGWFLPVTPGTSQVTVGGAIASDVHGKNHHHAGTFGQHVTAIEVLLGTGEVVTASSTERADLFQATCGGMGLTGIILSATLQLIPIRSSRMRQTTLKLSHLEAACEAFDAHTDATYSVAWIDCLATGRQLGRSVLMLGEHDDIGGLELPLKDPLQVPLYAPTALLNGLTMRAFNQAYWSRARASESAPISMLPYFYPLDAIGAWNKLYGRNGFLQYQFVLPRTDGIPNLKRVLNRIAKSGQVSFLAVLKALGPVNANLLSFPIEGYTLALDFKCSPSTIELLHELDDWIMGMGGRVYLTKDAVMCETTFKSTYPRWAEFEAVRERYGAIGAFASAQSKRLGLG